MLKVDENGDLCVEIKGLTGAGSKIFVGKVVNYVITNSILDGRAV